MKTIDFQRLPGPFPKPRCLLQRILCLGKWSNSRLAATMAMTKHFEKNSAPINLRVVPKYSRGNWLEYSQK